MSEAATEEKVCAKCKGLGRVAVKHDGKGETPWWYSRTMPFLLHLNAGKTIGVPAGHVVENCPDCQAKVK